MLSTNQTKWQIKNTKKAKKLHQKYKLNLAARKKAICLYRVRSLKSYNARSLLAAGTPLSADASVVTGLKKTCTLREVNRYLYDKKCLTRCAAPAKHASRGARISNKGVILKPTLRATYQLKQAAARAVDRYRRHLQQQPSAPQQVATSRKTGQSVHTANRYKKRYNRVRTKMLGLALLAQSAAPALRVTRLPAPTTGSSYAGSTLFDNQFTSTSAGYAANQLPLLVRAGSGNLTVSRKLKPASRRRKKIETYLGTKRTFLTVDKDLRKLKNFCSHLRTATVAAGVKTYFQDYQKIKSSLRGRFFTYKVWTTKLANRTRGLPTLNRPQVYNYKRFADLRVQQKLLRLDARKKSRSLLSVTRKTVEAARKKKLLRAAISKYCHKRIPLPIPARTAAIKRGASIRAFVRPGAVSTRPRLQPRALTKRQRRVVAKAIRRRKNISKGQLKRLRLGRVRQHVKIRTYPNLLRVFPRVPAVQWKRKPARKQRFRAYRQLSAIKAALLLLTKVKARRLAFNPTGAVAKKTPQNLNPVRTTLRSLLFITTKCRTAGSLIGEKQALTEKLIRQLRRALRTGVQPTNGWITSAFSFLRSALLGGSPSKALLDRELAVWKKAQKTTAPVKASKKGNTFLTTFHALDSKRFFFRKLLTSKVPLSTNVTNPVSVSVSTVGRSAPKEEVTLFGNELASPRINSNVSTLDTNLVSKSIYFVSHHAALTPAYAHPKKRLLYRLAGRRSRFRRFIPNFVRNRLTREASGLSDKLASPGNPTPTIRYYRHVYPKGTRVFAGYYKKGRRIRAHRLVTQQRWSRATALHLSRRRLAWRHTPQTLRTRTSTGRIATCARYAAGNKGWRARKIRAKVRSTQRLRVEQNAAVLRQLADLQSAKVLRAQNNIPPRALLLLTGNDCLHQLPAGAAKNTEPVTIRAFCTAQQRLANQQKLRTVSARTKFSFASQQYSKGFYTRRRGKFTSPKDKRRKKPRTPRAIRSISKCPANRLRFSAQTPEFLLVKKESFSPLSTSPEQLRAQLRGSTPERVTLAKKMRRLFLIKSLLQRNKFTKLARLGELGVLEEYACLGKLGELFLLGGLTDELKEQLLLKLAIDIKLCASRYVSYAGPASPVLAATMHTGPRIALVYNSVPPASGRDPEFFQVDGPATKVAPKDRLRVTALLRGLTRVRGKTSLFTGAESCAVVRTARSVKLSTVKRLRHYRNALAPREKAEQIELLWRRTRARRRSTRPAPRLQRTRVRGQQNIKFTSAKNLPAVFTRTYGLVVAPRVWTTKLGRWSSTTKHTGVRLLPKDFSAARPWGVKTLYARGISEEYARFTSGSAATLLALKRAKRLSHTKAGHLAAITSTRKVLLRVVDAHSPMKVLHHSPASTGRAFWQLRYQTREQVRLRAEEYSRALALRSKNKNTPAIKRTKPTRNPRLVKKARPSKVVRAVKTSPIKVATERGALPVKIKLPSTYLRILELNIPVFDPTVQSSLLKFSNLPAIARGGQQEYDLIKRAYKAALSSQIKNPALATPDFEKQKAGVYALFVKSTGFTPANASVPEWKQLPRNAVTAVKTVTLPSAAPTTSRPSISHGELTAREVEAILDAATRQNLQDFLATALQNRRSERAHTLVRKAVLRSWTLVENAGSPEESPYYADLLASIKAYSFYGVALDLTSKAATVSKLAPKFSKLPK